MIRNFLQKIFAILLVVWAFSFAYTEDMTFDPETGLAIKESGELVGIDRARRYLEIDFDDAGITSLAKGKTDCKIFDKEGKEATESLYLFEDVSVRRLVFGDSIKEIDSRIFTKIRDLEEIVFKGEDVPKFTEERHWYRIGEDDWRDSLRRVVFKHRPQLERIDFISFVKEIVLSEEAPAATLSEDLGVLSKCASLERLMVPYALAVREDIPWDDILQNTPIREKGLCSEAKGGRIAKEATDADDCVLLWPVIKGGRVTMPDEVTHIRADILTRVARNYGNLPVVLPPSFKAFIGNPPTGAHTFYLKKEAVQTFPDVVSLRVRGRGHVFPRFADKTVLSVISPYASLWAGTAKKNAESALFYRSESNGLVYRIRVPLEMNSEHTLKFAFAGSPESEAPNYEAIIDPGKLESLEITFKTPPARHWVGQALFWCALGFFGIPLLMKSECFPKASKRYFAEPWGVHVLFCFAVVFFALGITGVLADWMDLYVWYPVLEYVNTSMISSLVISVSTTAIQFLLSLLQGLKFSIYVLQVDMSQILAPVTDILGRISRMSWLSTIVLTCVRMIGEILRAHGALLLGCMGGVALSWSFPGMERIRSWRYFRIVATALFGISVGLPFTLFACSWFSGALLEQAGNTFNDALGSFRTLAASFTFSALLSMSALQEMVALLGDAVTTLCASAMGYVAVKAFDCFLMPLGLLWVVLKILRSFGVKQDLDFKELLRLSKQNGGRNLALSDITQGQALPSADQTSEVPLSTEAKPKETVPASATATPTPHTTTTPNASEASDAPAGKPMAQS